MANDPRWAGAQPLISVDQLFEIKRHGSIVILDARISRQQGLDGRASYRSGYWSFLEEGHIPEAVFADLFEVFSNPASAYPFTRPSIDELQHSLAMIGIDDRTQIVVYDSLNGAWAARLWWVLKAAGLPNVSVLNGGFEAWKAGGHPVDFGPQESAPALNSLSLGKAGKRFVDLPDMMSLVQTKTRSKLICALRPAEYETGHIPGSVSLPYASIVNSAGQIDLRLAEAAAEALDISKDDSIVIYCGGGINAAGLGLALTSAGFDRVAVYDGSLAEWRDDPSRPLIVGGAPL